MWLKKGLIFKVDGNHDWMQTHAQVPLAEKVGVDRLRIYFGTRDRHNRTLPTYIEVEASDPQNVLYVHDEPLLSLGKPGCFDDSGVMPHWIVNCGSRKYLYYIGWNVGTTVRYHLAIGVAVSHDGGLTFTKLYEGPIMNRSCLEPYYVSGPCVLIDEGMWRMWYLSGVGWGMNGNRMESRHDVRYAESTNGIRWSIKEQVSIGLRPGEHGIARPCVIKEGNLYWMWYSHRGQEHSYRIGYAESDDGFKWIRKDETVGLDVSASGWDSEMMAYPYVYTYLGKRYMLYNGNGFGESGFGYAVEA